MKRSVGDRMRILFAADVMPDPDSGASGTEVRTIEALRDLGHDVDEIWADELPRRFAHGNLHYVLELPRAYRRALEARLATGDYDVMHFNQSHCYDAARSYRRRGGRGVFVYRSHGLEDNAMRILEPWRAQFGLEPRSRFRRAMQQVMARLLHRHDLLAYRHVDGILVSCATDRDYLVDRVGIAPRRVGCVPQAPSPAFVARPPRPLDEARLKRILHVGGFAYFKGVHAVAATFSTLLEADQTLQATWVCHGNDHERARAMLSPEARERVRFLDWMAQAELAELCDAHGFFLCPSLYEGFGKAFVEAMARGMCVIGTRAGAMADFIDDGANGLLVPFDAPLEIVKAVRSLLEDPARAARIACRGQATAGELSWPRTAREIAGFYEQLLHRRRKSERP